MCSRWPCGRYTTTLPFRGSGATGPAHACHSSRHTALGLGWGGGGGVPVAAELVRLCCDRDWEQLLLALAATSSASSSSSSTVSLRSIPVIAAALDDATEARSTRREAAARGAEGSEVINEEGGVR
uniref:Uncharacterized protein n=1 Tax=Arundo donax TaxID=35708 RepID=A0A0A9D9B8_ARUDO